MKRDDHMINQSLSQYLELWSMRILIEFYSRVSDADDPLKTTDQTRRLGLIVCFSCCIQINTSYLIVLGIIAYLNCAFLFWKMMSGVLFTYYTIISSLESTLLCWLLRWIFCLYFWDPHESHNRTHRSLRFVNSCTNSINGSL